MASSSAQNLRPLSTDQPIWDRFFTVSPLVLIASKEGDHFNIAPKHMAMPLGWENYYCFVCSPSHATYCNIQRHRVYTVNYPRPSQLLESSLAASPRNAEHAKPSLAVLPTTPATKVDGVLVQDCYLCIECELDRIIDGFGENSLILGRVVAASAQEEALRKVDLDDNDLIYQSPLLAYLNPGRMAEIRQSVSFPFPVGFTR